MSNFKKFITIQEDSDNSSTIRYCFDGVKIIEYPIQTPIDELITELILSTK